MKMTFNYIFLAVLIFVTAISAEANTSYDRALTLVEKADSQRNEANAQRNEALAKTAKAEGQVQALETYGKAQWQRAEDNYRKFKAERNGKLTVAGIAGGLCLVIGFLFGRRNRSQERGFPVPQVQTVRATPRKRAPAKKKTPPKKK